ncbi:MAG: rhodanese-like domain-containing protein [Gammaproteobacteria bacterium]|nr:rhodanese-like domain-containing protein [Gammaproteobacteria bacterium]MCW9057366.1 rhodanese-like domain-containing protein [Gammaproteobacteria bacterium]
MYGIQEIDSATLEHQLRADPDHYRLVDVRGPAEWPQGIIEGAELLPLHLLPLQAGQWRDPRPILFYCRSGARSAQACAWMMAQGHGAVVNLRGGVLDWARHGLPLVPPGEARATG